MYRSDSSLLSTLHTLGFIEAITKFNGGNPYQKRESSTEDYVGRITAVFLPYMKNSVSEKDFNSVQTSLKKIVTEIKK